jgi:hypothetical protein
VAAIIEARPRSPRAAFDDAVDAYLSALHRDHPEFGCAPAVLAADAGRRDAEVQAGLSRGLGGLNGVLQREYVCPKVPALRFRALRSYSRVARVPPSTTRVVPCTYPASSLAR